MEKRHQTIGIKQVIRFEWMQEVANLLLAELDTYTIRQKLHEFLANRKSNGSEGKRSDQTRSFAVTNLMQIWVPSEPDLVSLRNALLALLRKYPSMGLAIHWSMISAAYPFWFNVAQHTGRLLALQDQVTQAQIINRTKEHHGDRQTVSRYARYVIRSFAAWGVLEDFGTKGCYGKTVPVDVTDPNLTTLMFESALLATPEAKGVLSLLVNNPAFFPFQLPWMTGSLVYQNSDRIDVVRCGLDDDLLALKDKTKIL